MLIIIIIIIHVHCLCCHCRLIDCFLVDAPTTSLSLSPSGDFLASSHVDDLGIYLWSNKTLYAHVSLRPLPANFKPSVAELPTTGSDGIEEAENEGIAFSARASILLTVCEILGAFEVEDVSVSQTDMETAKDKASATSPLAAGLVTLSSLPKSRWHNLQNLDIIKVYTVCI